MLIINGLQNFQAKTQAILECHNFWMVAPNKGSKIDGKIGNEPVFFYEPFIGQHVSVVDVVVRIRQESIERPMAHHRRNHIVDPCNLEFMLFLVLDCIDSIQGMDCLIDVADSHYVHITPIPVHSIVRRTSRLVPYSPLVWKSRRKLSPSGLERLISNRMQARVLFCYLNLHFYS